MFCKSWCGHEPHVVFCATFVLDLRHGVSGGAKHTIEMKFTVPRCIIMQSNTRYHCMCFGCPHHNHHYPCSERDLSE